jgi:hypothetical protein
MFILPYVALKKQTTDEYNTTPQSFWQMLLRILRKEMGIAGKPLLKKWFSRALSRKL